MSDEIEFKFKPLGDWWPREQTPKGERRNNPFKTPGKYEPNISGGSTYKSGGRMPLTRTYDDLRKELKHFALRSVVVVRLKGADRIRATDGLPISGVGKLNFPGVALQFTARVGERDSALQFVCDACDRWEDNLRAIVLTLERLRLADLYGVTKHGEQYTGWKALPDAVITPPPMSVEEATAFIRQHGASQDVAAAFRICAKKFHPDGRGGGDDVMWAMLQQAKEVLKLSDVR